MFPLFLAAALTLGAAMPQESPAKVPQKGDSVIIKGCLRGSSLEATETAIPNSDATMTTALVYRLTGDKGLLKKMRQEHDGSVVEVSGILKSSLPTGAERGTTIGNTRVRIGVGGPGVGSPVQSEANRSIPVVQVKSYEGVPVKCGG